MRETVLMGRGRHLVELPRAQWEGHLSQIPAHADARLRFMSEDHHRVRYFVVRELPRVGQPIPAAMIANRLALPPAQVKTILDDLERHLFFLVRNEAGAVAWAYPLTTDPTPHRLSFSTGEHIYAA